MIEKDWTNTLLSSPFMKTMADNLNKSASERDPRTTPLYGEIITHLETDGTVIDIGAGVGRFAIPLAKEGFNVTAVEPTEECGLPFEPCIGEPYHPKQNAHNHFISGHIPYKPVSICHSIHCLIQVTTTPFSYFWISFDTLRLNRSELRTTDVELIPMASAESMGRNE